MNIETVAVNREWTEDGELWVQYVSAQPATRSDAISLGERLDQRLQVFCFFNGSANLKNTISLDSTSPL